MVRTISTRISLPLLQDSLPKSPKKRFSLRVWKPLPQTLNSQCTSSQGAVRRLSTLVGFVGSGTQIFHRDRLPSRDLTSHNDQPSLSLSLTLDFLFPNVFVVVLFERRIVDVLTNLELQYT